MNEGQSNEDLKNYCRILGIQIDEICLIEDLDLSDKNKHYYIINLTPNEKTVGHWLALCCLPTKIFYFDSFGGKVPDIIKRQAKELNKKLYVSKLQIQKLEESNCGWYCCLFLFLFQKMNPKDEESFRYLLNELASYEIVCN